MDILNYQQGFGAEDVTSPAMQEAIENWFHLYYREGEEQGEDPCQRIAYTVVSKLVRWVFAEYNARADSDFAKEILQSLSRQKVLAVQLALVGGESYLKPIPTGKGFDFLCVPRNRILIFARNEKGEPTDVGTVEHSSEKGFYYTLLERRWLDGKGYLTVENRLYRSKDPNTLGTEVELSSRYPDFVPRYTFQKPLHSVGLIRLKTPQFNCVDGASEGVSVYAPAVGLIRAIDRNEYLLREEFERGQSRIIASRDMLREDGSLTDNLFVGLDEDPENVGITVFAPELRHQAYLERKREYLRNVEAVVGLQRGVLSDVANMQRTATEISATQAEHCLTVMDFQGMWHQAVQDSLALCAKLGALYGLDAQPEQAVIDWGNGVLYDEEKLWQEYKDMVDKGLIAPEVALGWRFNLPAETEAQRAVIREKYM